MNIKMSSPDINEADKKAVMEVLDSGWLSMGPKVREFEERFAEYIGVKHAIAVNSGTSGLHLARKCRKPRWTTPFSFVASANVAKFSTATEHRPEVRDFSFLDILSKTLEIDMKYVRQEERAEVAYVKSGCIPLYPLRNTAVLSVDVFGQPCDYDSYPGVVIIEDACEAIGAEYKGRKAGTLGDISVFAFYPNKQMTTGEGGMICTDSDEWAELCRSWRNQGRGTGDDWFNHVRIGYNYRMDEMSAALGLSQLSRIEELLQKREQVARWYTERLKDRIELLYISPNTTRMSWFVYPVFTDEREALIARLEENNIPSRKYFKPIHLMPMYGYPEGSFPNAERAGKRCLALPFSGVMTEKEVDYVCRFV